MARSARGTLQRPRPREGTIHPDLFRQTSVKCARFRGQNVIRRECIQTVNGVPVVGKLVVLFALITLAVAARYFWKSNAPPHISIGESNLRSAPAEHISLFPREVLSSAKACCVQGLDATGLRFGRNTFTGRQKLDKAPYNGVELAALSSDAC